jgi:hypothetical protein
MRRIGLVVAACVCVAAAVAAQGKTVKSSNGSCELAVPATWNVGDLPSSADSADKKVNVIVSSPKVIDTFDELKQTARTVYKDSKVTKDSATEFEMVGKSITGKPDVYRAIPAGGAGKFCVAEITYLAGTPEDASKILAALKSTGK